MEETGPFGQRLVPTPCVLRIAYRVSVSHNPDRITDRMYRTRSQRVMYHTFSPPRAGKS